MNDHTPPAEPRYKSPRKVMTPQEKNAACLLRCFTSNPTQRSARDRLDAALNAMELAARLGLIAKKAAAPPKAR